MRGEERRNEGGGRRECGGRDRKRGEEDRGGECGERKGGMEEGMGKEKKMEMERTGEEGGRRGDERRGEHSRQDRTGGDKRRRDEKRREGIARFRVRFRVSLGFVVSVVLCYAVLCRAVPCNESYFLATQTADRLARWRVSYASVPPPSTYLSVYACRTVCIETNVKARIVWM